MDWLDLLAVQGTLKSLLQHHSSKVSILWHSAFFTVQLSHPYMTTGKTIAFTRRTFKFFIFWEQSPVQKSYCHMAQVTMKSTMKTGLKTHRSVMVIIQTKWSLVQLQDWFHKYCPVSTFSTTEIHLSFQNNIISFPIVLPNWWCAYVYLCKY